LAACHGAAGQVEYVFEMTHARDYQRHLPAMLLAPELDVDEPAFVVVFARGADVWSGLSRPPGATGPASPSPRPNERSVCVLVSEVTNVYAYVDISGMQADLGGDAAAPSRSPIESTSLTVTDAAHGISFERPVTWTRWQPNEHDPINDGPLIYLSTDPLLPACATAADATPNPPGAQGWACDWPLTSLSSNGVFVNWLNKRLLESMPSAGEVLLMNGESARLQIERPGSCAQIGGDETISVLVPIGQPTPLSNVAVVACLRGPDVATAAAQLRALLASARVQR
jgi:hypothetical protein